MELLKVNAEMFKIVNVDDKPFFYGSAIAKYLEYVRPGNALKDHVSEENKKQVRSLNSEHRVLINEIGVYELIFSSKRPLAKQFRDYVFNTILPAFRKGLIQIPFEEIEPATTKPIGNQLMIMNEFDLQVKLVAYIRKYYPDVMFMSTHGEMQTTPQKRIVCKMKGYLKGVPDIYIMEPNVKDNGYFIELKSPTLKGIISPDQQSVIDRLKIRGYKCNIFDDYDDAIYNITKYLSNRILICPHCKKSFKTETLLNNHIHLKEKKN